MKIQIKDMFGLTETAVIPDVKPAQIERTVIDGMEHFALGGVVLVTIDHEERRILFADKRVTVFHHFEGKCQRFQGISGV
jgi:hypothetical protein